MRKVLLLTNIISPYRVPLFNELSRKITLKGLVFEVWFLAIKDKNRKWNVNRNEIKFHYKILPNIRFYIQKMDWGIYLNPFIFFRLLWKSPDIIIGLYDNPTYWIAFLYAKLFKKKFILWNGSTLKSSTQLSGFIGFLKRLIVRKSDAIITYGKMATDYVIYFGASKKRVFTGCNTVDIAFYKQAISYLSGGGLATEFGKINILYVGQLIERKNLFTLIKAFARIKFQDVHLIIVGDGPLNLKLQKYCKNNGVSNIHFEGYKQKADLLRYYAISQIFVLPSYKEVWGLVVNEALSAGLFTIVSESAGASELIIEGENGYKFDPFNIDDLTEKLINSIDKIKNGSLDRGSISSSILQCNIENYADSFYNAIRYVLDPMINKK